MSRSVRVHASTSERGLRQNGATRLIALSAVVALGAAACGGDGDEGADGGTQDGGGDAVALCDGEVEGGSISMFAHEGSEADAYRAAIESFNSGPGQDLGITVELTMIPEGQYTDQINAAAASGDLPAVLDLDGPVMANLAWGGSLVPISGCISTELEQDLLPSLIQQGTYADDLYAVGSFDSGLGLYAWSSALEEVGARVPTSADDAWTAEEFEQILRDLQDAGDRKSVV